MRSITSAFTVAAIVTCATAGTALAQQPPPPPPPAVTITAATADTPVPPPPVTVASTDAEPAPTRTPAPDLPPPEGSTTQSPINRPLMATSLVLLGGTYLASAVDGATSGRDADRNNLLIPIVGPWMDYANRDCGTPGKCNANEGGYKALLVLGGIGQGLGALGLVTSLFLPEKTNRNWYLIGGSGLHAAPSPVGSGYGVGAGGVF